MSAMPLPVCGRRRRRQSSPELVFGFSPEGRRREEAFYLSLDGNAEIEELLERSGPGRRRRASRRQPEAAVEAEAVVPRLEPEPEEAGRRPS